MTYTYTAGCYAYGIYEVLPGGLLCVRGRTPACFNNRIHIVRCERIK